MFEETQASVLADRPTDEVEVEVPEIPADKSVPEGAEADKAGTDEHGEQADANSTDEETPEKKGTSGYQRAKVRLEKTRQERDFWREEALRNRSQQATPKTEPEDELPKLPKLSEYAGTIEQYEKEAEAFQAKFAKALEAKAQKAETQRQTTQAIQAFNERLRSIPEFEQVKAQAESMPNELLGYVEQVAARLKNGPDVVKEVILDPDLREQLMQLASARDGQAITGHLMAISTGLLFANRKAAAAAKDDPAVTTRAPQPTPKSTKPAGKATVDINDPNLSYRDFVKAREAQKKER